MTVPCPVPAALVCSRPVGLMRHAFVIVALVAAVAMTAVAAPHRGNNPAKYFDDPLFWKAALNSTDDPGRQWMLNSMQSSWNNRNAIGYTQGSQRWSGIDEKIRPPGNPPWADCSSWATWIFWTIWGPPGAFPCSLLRLRLLLLLHRAPGDERVCP